MISSTGYSAVVDETAKPADLPKWFAGARLNYAENMLWRDDDGVAIYATGTPRLPALLCSRGH